MMICLLLFATTACVEPATDDPEPSAIDDPVPDDTVFTEIDVELGPNGPVISAPRAITAGAERAQNELRVHGTVAAAAAAEDPVCAGNSFWLYDQNNLLGNRICFHGVGFVELTGYVIWVYSYGQWRAVGTWSISRGSYWPGNQGGNLYNNNFPPGRTAFVAGQSFTNFNIPSLRLIYVQLN